jgi:formate dehydrogenase major subunit
MEAKRNRNAKLISVDPRFTRTSATADLFVQIRAGTDIAFLGGLIRYAIENNRIAKEYLVNYTNAAFIVKEGFKLPEDGLYSGFNSATGTYDKSTWNYEGGRAFRARRRGRLARARASAQPQGRRMPGTAAPSAGERCLRSDAPASALRLPIDEAAIFPLHARNRRTDHGHPEGSISEGRRSIYLVRKDGDMKKVATIIYAVGWTQHTFGTQIIRTAAMIQLLLGNVGRAGGGVNALRGHSNIQGATDMAGCTTHCLDT